VGVKELVAEAESRVKSVTAAELDEERASGSPLVVDVRDVRERWRDGAIPDSVHVPRGMLEFWADPDCEYHKTYMQPDRRVILYCNLGQRSALAADALQRLGYHDVAHLKGGFDGWCVEGLPVIEVPRK
jgi:rhodanese-related sulfurtransferase